MSQDQMNKSEEDQPPMPRRMIVRGEGLMKKSDFRTLNKKREKAGEKTCTNPRWALVCKFAPRREITHIRKIRAQVGRTGFVTPVADLRPVNIDGAKVSHVTPHHQDEVDRLDVSDGKNPGQTKTSRAVKHDVTQTDEKVFLKTRRGTEL